MYSHAAARCAFVAFEKMTMFVPAIALPWPFRPEGRAATFIENLPPSAASSYGYPAIVDRSNAERPAPSAVSPG